MIKLEKPVYKQEKIIDDCISNMQEGILKQHILDSKNEIISGGATKDDMIKLYDRKFVPKGEGGRKYYDAIKLLSPNLICPYCAQRDVDTLDHYLPKAKYPIYAITPYNLVPSCMGCNKVKVDNVFQQRAEETIHPYYDDFASEKWIAAQMIEGDPVAFRFIVQCPDTWDSVKKERAQKHFEQFKLNDLYKNKASQEYIGCLNRIKRSYRRGGKTLAIEDLREHIEDKDVIHPNTWQAAMYQAIIDNEWFWNVYLPEMIV